MITIIKSWQSPDWGMAPNRKISRRGKRLQRRVEPWELRKKTKIFSMKEQLPWKMGHISPLLPVLLLLSELGYEGLGEDFWQSLLSVSLSTGAIFSYCYFVPSQRLPHLVGEWAEWFHPHSAAAPSSRRKQLLQLWWRKPQVLLREARVRVFPGLGCNGTLQSQLTGCANADHYCRHW